MDAELRTEDWNSRRRLLNFTTRLQCPSGCGLQTVIDFKPLARLAVLACLHTRTAKTGRRDE